MRSRMPRLYLTFLPAIDTAGFPPCEFAVAWIFGFSCLGVLDSFLLSLPLLMVGPFNVHLTDARRASDSTHGSSSFGGTAGGGQDRSGRFISLHFDAVAAQACRLELALFGILSGHASRDARRFFHGGFFLRCCCCQQRRLCQFGHQLFPKFCLVGLCGRMYVLRRGVLGARFMPARAPPRPDKWPTS